MSFEDFEGKNRWRIKKSDARCEVGEVITVAGPENRVAVSCGDGHAYVAAAYDRASRSIQGDLGHFVLTLEGKDLLCTYKDARDEITGSWTAEDIGNLDDEGKARPVTASPLG